MGRFLLLSGGMDRTMFNFRRIICVLLAFPIGLFSLSAGAEVYKYIDKEGNVVFTDKYTPNAEKLNLPPPAKGEKKQRKVDKKSKKTAASKDVPKKEKPKFTGYKQFDLVSPSNDSVIRDNSGNLTLKIAIKPKLQTKLNHRLFVYLDGVRVKGAWTGDVVTLPNIDRGSHTVRVEVVDRSLSLRLMRTKTVIFHMKRASRFFFNR